MVRVASLVPSATDLVAALGGADRLVARSHECDHVASDGLPVATRTRIPAAGKPPASGGTASTPREVEDAVQLALTEGRALYETDLALLESLRPDVVIAQDVCDVCAVSADQTACMLPTGARLVRMSGRTIAGLEEDARRVAEALGIDPDPCLRGMRARLDRIAAMVADRPRPRVVAIEWSDPPYLGGHWVPELIAIAGGEDVLAAPGEHSRRVTWEEIQAARPDVVVHMPCGFDLAHARDDAAREVAPRLPDGAALWVTDADKLFSRCTPVSLGAGAEALAGIFHPDVPGLCGPNFENNAVLLPVSA